MIFVTVCEDNLGRIESFKMTGHADFAEHGKDLVCAGASAVSFGAVNAIISLTGVTPDIQLEDEGGYLQVTLPKIEQDKKDEQIQLIVRSMIVSLQTIENDYSQYIKIVFK